MPPPMPNRSSSRPAGRQPLSVRRAKEPDAIEVRGAREHNLDVPHLSIPKRALVVFTGPSGSGKSSLAFDTLYAEGQRRYLETLSAYARQFLGQLERPHVERIRGLSPTIAIEQKSAASSEQDENAYRHAFLILEKRDGSHDEPPHIARHVLCAESDEERDDWVDVLVRAIADEVANQRSATGGYGARGATTAPAGASTAITLNKRA